LEEAIAKRYIECNDGFMNAKTLEEALQYSCQKTRDDFQKKIAEAKAKGSLDQQEKAIDGWFKFLKMMRCRTVKVTKVVVKDDKAELTATSSDSGQIGDMFNGLNKMIPTAGAKPTPMYTRNDGVIKMVKENGVWMMEQETWNGSTSNLTPQQQAKKKVTSDWCAQAASLPFPQKPAAGMLHGQPFKVERVEMSKNLTLSLKQGGDFLADREVTIFIFSMDGAPDGQKIIEKDGSSITKAHCHVHIKWKKGEGDKHESEAFMGMDGYGLHLMFGKRTNGRLPGYIMLRLPDKQKSFVEGYFYIPAKS